MKQIILIVLASMLIFSSFKEINGVTITLETKNFDLGLIKIYEPMGTPIMFDNEKMEDGKFTFILPLDNACIKSFTFGPQMKRIFLYPGQSLQISFDAKNFDITFKHGGSLAVENTLLNSVIQLMDKIDLKYLYTQDLDIAYHYIDSTFNVSKQYFEKHVSDIQTTAQFIDYTKASIHYMSAFTKMYLAERQKAVDDSNKYSFLGQITIENENYLQIPYYQWFLNYYISMETNKRYENLDSVEKLAEGAKFNQRLEVIRNLKNHNVREFSLAYEIDSRLQAKGVKYFDKYYDYFKKNNSNPLYSELIKKEYEKKQLLAPGKPAPQFTLSDVNGKKVSLSDFKGKYVLIDFWQTLCPSSARELPHYLKLYADYKDENIAFVSISINQDEKVWKDYVKEKKNVGTSLRAENYSGSEVYKAYQVPFLPTFVIIDTDGNIIDPLAPKPSSTEIREKLDQLLKNR